MARTSVVVDKLIYQKLKLAYERKCGGSPSNLIDALDLNFPKAKGGHVVGERTLREFFKEDSQPKISPVTLNYLCKFLLEIDSYQDALQSLKNLDVSTEIQSLVLSDDRLASYLEDYQEYLHRKCGSVRIPYMTHPRALPEIYVDCQLQEDLQSRRPRSLPELQSELENKKLSRLKSVNIEDIFRQHSRLMIWGTTGSGKTTLLKHCISTRISISPIQIPVFISLIDYIKLSETRVISLIDAIIQELVSGGFNAPEAVEWSRDRLQQGCFWIALDGLDEIPQARIGKFYDEVEQLVQQFPKNHYILTCRVGGTEHPPRFFIEVEVAKWAEAQIKDFVDKWFTTAETPDLAGEFLHDLQENPLTQQLAVNPLLLTLLCHLYENDYGFPRNQANLLEDAVELYLRKWDEFRRIEREPIYDKKLTRQRRRDLFTRIAAAAMSIGKTAWQRWELEDEIKKFMQNIPGVTDSSLEIDTQTVLFAIEAQHGLLIRTAKDHYEFAHRSFQEYFVVQYLLEEIGNDTQKLDEVLNKHLLDRNYRNILLLLAERQRDAAPMLKHLLAYLQKIVVSSIEKGKDRVQEHLQWLQEITEAAKVSTAAWRACLCSYDLETPAFSRHSHTEAVRSEAQQLAAKLRRFNQLQDCLTPPTPRITLVLRLAVIARLVTDRAEGKTEEKLQELEKFDPAYRNYQENLKQYFIELRDLLTKAGVPEMARPLQKLSQAFPSEDAMPKVWEQWLEALNQVTKEYLSLGYAHSIDEEDLQTLNDYIYIADLVADMVLRDIYCKPEVKRQVVESLFLPVGS